MKRLIGSVKMKYMEHEIDSVHMDLSFKDQTAVLYRNVEIKNYELNVINIGDCAGPRSAPFVIYEGRLTGLKIGLHKFFPSQTNSSIF